MNGSKIIPIAHALPVFLGTDGQLRVLLGEKRYGERADIILLQPFGGKVNPGESLIKAGIREWGEELHALDPEQLARLFEPRKFLGIFTANSDLNSDKVIQISCWWARFLTQFKVGEKAGSEMKKPAWYTFQEVLTNPYAGTLTKLMVAVLGSKIYFRDDCIQYLRRLDTSSQHPAVAVTVKDTLARVRDTIKTEFSTNVDPRDTGLIELLRRNGLSIKPLPNKVFFRGGKICRVE